MVRAEIGQRPIRMGGLKKWSVCLYFRRPQVAGRRPTRTQMPLRGDRLKLTTTLRETLSA